MSRNLPEIVFTPEGMQILKKSLALFAEALARNRLPLPHLDIAHVSFESLRAKVDELCLLIKPRAEFDFNEAVIIMASVNMYLLDISLFNRVEASVDNIDTCHAIIAYFTMIQVQPRVDY